MASRKKLCLSTRIWRLGGHDLNSYVPAVHSMTSREVREEGRGGISGIPQVNFCILRWSRLGGRRGIWITYKLETERWVRWVNAERNGSLGTGENVPTSSRDVRECGRVVRVCLKLTNSRRNFFNCGISRKGSREFVNTLGDSGSIDEKLSYRPASER